MFQTQKQYNVLQTPQSKISFSLVTRLHDLLFYELKYNFIFVHYAEITDALAHKTKLS